MALKYLGGTTTTESLGGKISIVTTYNANRDVTHETVTHRHTTTGMTFVFEYGGAASDGDGQTSSSVVTGIDPSQVQNALYGKIIPLSVLGTNDLGGGLERIGTAGLIFGPYFSNGLASFAVSFGFPANVTGTRRVYEVALDGKVAWETSTGSGAGDLDPAGFIAEPFTCRFYSGTMTQPADPLEVAQFGAEAVAYRPQMCLWFHNLPLTLYDGKVPFVSAKIGDVTGGAVAGDGINLGEALESIAYSPWLEFAPATFVTEGVQETVQAMILTEDQSFLDLLRNTARVYRTLDILQTDRLRVSDRGATTTPDVTLGRDHIVAEAGVQYGRQEQGSLPRELELITIDQDQDYMFVPSKAARPRYPVPVTSSVGKETISLPVVIDASTRMALVTYAKYEEENARKHIGLQAMLYGYQLEPGDLFRLDNVAAGYDLVETFKVTETSHGANYIVEITGEAILKCALEFGDPYLSYVVLLMGFEGADGATGAPGMTDESPTLKGNGSALAGAVIDTGESKYGNASLNLLGSSTSRVLFGWSADWTLSHSNSDQFTVELWGMLAATTPIPVQERALLWYSESLGSQGWVFWINTDGELQFLGSNTGTLWQWNATSSGLGWELERWYHLACDKDATGKVRIYRDGVMVGSVTPADSSMITPSIFLHIGIAVSEDNWTGWLDEIRITKGIARYASDGGFTVPPFAFPREAP